MAMRTIQVQHLAGDDLEDWYSDVIPQIGDTVRLDIDEHGKHYRVVNVIHRLWPEELRAMTMPIIVLAEIASEVPDASQNG